MKPPCPQFPLLAFVSEWQLTARNIDTLRAAKRGGVIVKDSTNARGLDKLCAMGFLQERTAGHYVRTPQLEMSIIPSKAAWLKKYPPRVAPA